jgi:hypothetical protein
MRVDRSSSLRMEPKVSERRASFRGNPGKGSVTLLVCTTAAGRWQGLPHGRSGVLHERERLPPHRCSCANLGSAGRRVYRSPAPRSLTSTRGGADYDGFSTHADIAELEGRVPSWAKPALYGYAAGAGAYSMLSCFTLALDFLGSVNVRIPFSYLACDSFSSTSWAKAKVLDCAPWYRSLCAAGPDLKPCSRLTPCLAAR